MSSETNSSNNCELPDKLSDLILLALKDIHKCEKSVKYSIDMSVWHFFSYENCAVCFAGAVMAQTCKIPFEKNSLFDDDFSELFPEELWHKFYALDAIREYNVKEALWNLHVAANADEREDIELTVLEGIIGMPYDKDPQSFKRNMRTIAKRLAKLGY